MWPEYLKTQGARTRLDLGALLLVGKELPELGLVFIAQSFQVGILQSGRCGVHFGL